MRDVRNTERRLTIGIVGYGQIARMQHAPALAASSGLRLAAIANPVAVQGPPGVPVYASLAEMLQCQPELDAVALCTPPQIRYGLARQALDAGRHVLLEKPPAATPAEIADLARHADKLGLTLFTAWHSLFSAAVDQARIILAERGVQGMRMAWKEDVRKWHPGVDWFWQPGGMGVFDSGMNAFSILVGVMPEPIFVRAAKLLIPQGAHTPMSARLEFATPGTGTGFYSEHDWDQQDGETWTIDWTLGDGGRLTLERGGALLRLDGRVLVEAQDEEYPRLYAHFETLLRTGRSDVEIRPLQLVADAFMLGAREAGSPVRP
ncbi:Gfo/Idh/MocA family protein [Lichenicoccus sp.]|uniref:Gfo/Idh/MocA family protein n=1 Tax=Lichenicoccus sp. TaxID=2781899 RepID=UPI003D1161EC